jgi:hypothetical protein
MKIIALLVLRKEPQANEPLILSSAYHLNDFGYFQRNRLVRVLLLHLYLFWSSIREFANFFAKTLVKRVPLGERASVEHEGR